MPEREPPEDLPMPDDSPAQGIDEDADNPPEPSEPA